MASRMSMYFRMGSGGWSESLYTQLAIDDAIAAGKTLATKRATIMVRVAVVQPIGARNPVTHVGKVDWAWAGLSGTAGNSLKRDLGNAAVQIELNASGRKSRPWLHGLPDEWMESPLSSSSAFTLTGDATLAVQAYLTTLLGQSTWQVRSLTEVLADATPRIDTFAIVAGKLVATIPGTALIRTDRVIITGAKGYLASQFNGRWRVEKVVGNDVTLSGVRTIGSAFQYVSTSAQIRRANPSDYGLYAISSATIMQPGTRKVGRPTFAPHGRR